VSTLGIDKDAIRELATILTEKDLAEIEIEKDGARIRVVAKQPQYIQGAAPVYAAAPVAAAPAAAPAAPAPAADAKPQNAVTSPMVGTAYLAPEPGAAPFVKEGDTVKEGQTLLIIEAMKTMNPVPAPKGGRVARILVADAQPVEFGEPLVVIE